MGMASAQARLLALFMRKPITQGNQQTENKTENNNNIQENLFNNNGEININNLIENSKNQNFKFFA